MKKTALLILPLLLSGCSAWQQVMDRMHTDTLNYQCGSKPLIVKLNNTTRTASFVYDNQWLQLKQGLSASGTRYTDGVYVFWSKGNEATVYRHDTIVLANCQLPDSKKH